MVKPLYKLLNNNNVRKIRLFVVMFLLAVLLPLNCVNAIDAPETKGVGNIYLGFSNVWRRAHPEAYAKETHVNIFVYIGSIISTFAVFLSVAFIVIVLISGYTLIFAGENQEKVRRAKLWLRNGVIGIIILVSIFIISEAVVYMVSRAVQ